MKLSTCAQALHLYVRAEAQHFIEKLPKPVLVGDSGIGKTDTVRSVFNTLVADGIFDPEKAVFIEKHLGQLELGDLIGLPDLDASSARTVWRAPCWWPEEDAEGILFFDEFGDTRNDVQRAVQQLMLEHKLYEHKLPKKVIIILAMNPVSSEFGSFEFSRQLKNRLMFWDIQPELEEWLKYVYSRDDLIDGLDKLVTSVPNGMLDRVEYDVSCGYRNPRSIVGMGKLAKIMTKEEISLFGFEVFSSMVGSELAATVVNFLTSNSGESLPISLQEILTLSPKALATRVKEIDPTSNRDSLYATSSVIATGLSTLSDNKKHVEVASLLENFPEDLASKCVKDINSANAMFALRMFNKSPKLSKLLNNFNKGD